MDPLIALLAILLVAGLVTVFVASKITGTLLLRTVVAAAGFIAIVLSLLYLGAFN